MTLSEMTKHERSLLLFFETCATDWGGTVAVQHMNDDDREIAKRWTEAGFVEFRRIPFLEIVQRGGATRTNFVTLSDDAWSLAHEERRARCERIRARIAWLADDAEAA